MLDAARARAEADAAEQRGAGTLWGAGPVAWEGVSVGAVAQAEVVPVFEDGGELSGAPPRIVGVRRTEVARETQEVPTALLAAILARLEVAPVAAEGVPTWLSEAIGNPLTYDAAALNRMDVCARVDPALYRRLQGMKERLGLRTTAGAWEYVLRVGLAVEGRGERFASRSRQKGRTPVPPPWWLRYCSRSIGVRMTKLKKVTATGSVTA